MSSLQTRPAAHQRLGTEVYRLIAKAAGQVLGRFECVETVYVRRSVAAGEVSFGRSDIDLGIVIRNPLSSPTGREQLLSLNRCYRLLRGLVPVVGECLVYDPHELQLAVRQDPFRGSLDRRAAMVVYGKSLRIPTLPITTPEAVRSTIFWFRYYLPLALRRRNLRNLRKLALEIWNGYAVATGLIAEPYLTRAEMEAAWRRVEGAAFPDYLGRDVEQSFAVCCRLAERLHPRLLPPLPKIKEPLIARKRNRAYVILPRAGYPLPPAAFAPDTFVGTPEILDLLIRYAGPFSFLTLPEELRVLRIGHPTLGEFIRLCPCRDLHVLRRPGFVEGRHCAPAVARSVLSLGQATDYLLRGEVPRPPREDQMADFLHAPTYGEYYRKWYPELYSKVDEAWRLLDRCNETPH